MFARRTQVLKISLFAILSAFAVELAFGLSFNSLGLITDSVHALLDSVVTVVLLLAARMAIKPPDAEHTYGHGKIETLGGLFGGIAILLIALFFIYESLVRLQSPQPEILPGIIAITAGIYTICVDVFRIVLLGKTIRKIGGATLKADFYHAMMDLGSTLVAIIGILLVTTGFYQGDFIAALVLGILLVALSLKLIYRTSMDLTDIISPHLVSKVKEIVLNTDGVLNVGPVLMRKSGDTIFCDVTISLRGDVSFDKAHEISVQTEKNIKEKISNCKTLVHFEPNWQDISNESKISDIVTSVEGVKGVHNISSYSSEGKLFVSIHVMVDTEKNLKQAHKISEIIEDKIQKSLPEIHHVTIHLEPFVTIPEKLNVVGKTTEEKIESILNEHSEIKKIGRIVLLQYKNIQKIDIDCSFDGDLSIERVHDLTSQIERKIRSQFKNAIITIHPEPD
ncbi:MAG: cation-efflux pump [Nitrosopumilaceae archaeon]|nr:cation-efflux pump [Nitrosopumilaceae archaeon]